MPGGTPLRMLILLASIVLAATAFFVTNSRNEDAAVREETTPESATSGANVREEATAYRLGASAYFPQGTNPPIGSGLAGARRGLSIELEDARFDGETVTALGSFIEGEPECRIVSENDGQEIPTNEDEIETAGDAFFYTATPDVPGVSVSTLVRCELVGRPADMDEIAVEKE